jgi:rhodanese-related sulfurtransferase
MTFEELIQLALQRVEELFPWDVETLLQDNPDTLVLDIREPAEFAAMRIEGSVNVPRGVLESACEYDYEDTLPELVEAREREILVVCRSGKRSALAAETMQKLGYRNVKSLKTGLRGWSDYELTLVDAQGEAVHEDAAEDYFTPRLSPEQLSKRG